MKKRTKKSLYSSDVYQESLDRIHQLTAETQPQWGRMSAAQMLAHCAEVQEVWNGKPLENTPFIAKLFKGMIRNMVVNDKPYPRNAKTHPQYLQTTVGDFAASKKRLLDAMATFKNTDPAEAPHHSLFGEMTPDEKGWGLYKHLNHHLTQFGV